jgi:hypothetical protein
MIVATNQFGPFAKGRHLIGAGGILLAAFGVALAAGEMHKTKPFKGSKVNAGFVIHEMKDGKHMLTLSDDFKSPDTPDPHWQVVDSKGTTHLLDRLMLKGDKLKKSIMVPGDVYDIAKVQIYCAWAEAVLGETTFDPPIRQ